ncbi:MAG: S41 family peptidase [Fimbriimonas sp.]|nr:S41 family peptidase [Fimbriimonas sp.]
MSCRRILVLILLAIAAAFQAASGQTIDNNPALKQEILDQVTDILSKSAFVPGVDFDRWPDFLKAERPQIDAANTDDEFQKAVNIALKKFGASHTVLNAPRIADVRLTGSMVGIGINTHPVADGLLVTRTVDDAPAARGGIVPGDIVVKVDGKPAKTAEAMSGPDGTDITLTVKHASQATEDYILTRRKFSAVRQEQMRWIDKKTALIEISSFGFTYDKERVAGFMREAQTSENLILDLRENGGGEIGNLRHLLGYLVPMDKPVGVFIDRNIFDAYVAANKKPTSDLFSIERWTKARLRPMPPTVPVYQGKVAVLIDAQSGSASEILAQGLRDVMGAKIVGTKSAGAVLVSLYVEASSGFYLQYPTSDYVTINGVRLEGLGVTPDVIVTDPAIHVPGAPDPVVDKAVSILK